MNWNQLTNEIESIIDSFKNGSIERATAIAAIQAAILKWNVNA